MNISLSFHFFVKCNYLINLLILDRNLIYSPGCPRSYDPPNLVFPGLEIQECVLMF